jgi:Glycosyltransferase family 87
MTPAISPRSEGWRVRLRALPWTELGLAEPPTLALLALLLLLHGAYSITPDITPTLRNLAFPAGSVVLAVLLLGCWLFWRPLFASPRPVARAAEPDLADALLPIVMIVSAAYFSLPNRLALALILGFVAVQGAILFGGRLRLSVAASGAALFGAFAIVVARTTINHLGADMLPVTAWADRVFLHGLNPYFEDYTSVTPGPFYYLPLQWLIYLPFVALHLDLRLLNLVAMLGMVALYLLLWRDIPRPWSGLAVLLVLIASRPSTEMIYQGEVWPLWFMVSAFVVAYYRRRWWLAAVLLGLLLACNQTTLVLAALLGVWQLRSGASWRITLGLGMVILAVYAAIVFPFARGIVAFIDQNYIALPHLAGVMSEHTYHNSITQVSLVNVLARLHLMALRGPLQLAIGITAMAVLALRRRTTPREFLAVCALTYLVAIGLNVQVWKYYYVQGLVLLFWSVYAPTGKAQEVAP